MGPPAIVANDPLIGRRLAGRVEIVAPLGAGGMGRVYRGLLLETNSQVAVKVLAPGDDRLAMAKRLNVEGVAAKRLKHPNVVQVLDMGVDSTDGLIFVVMEYLEGKDLAHLLRDAKPLSVARACRIMRAVLDGLAEAHAANVLHRDIKPGNIMLTRTRSANGLFTDQVKVVDFGLAKLGGEMTSLTETGFVAGTPGFMSPEQAMGEELDGRTDVYSCGVTLHRLIAGEMPFKGDKFAAVLRALREEPPIITGIPPELNQLLRWSLAAERERRCPSARAFSDALAPFVDDGTWAGSARARPLQARVEPSPGALVPDVPAPAVPTPGSTAANQTVNLRSPHAPPTPAQPRGRVAQLVGSSPVGELLRGPQLGVVRLGGVLALGAGLGLLYAWWRAPAPVELGPLPGAAVQQLALKVALGATEEAERQLIFEADELVDPHAAELAARVLELRRKGRDLHFDPGYRLVSSSAEITANRTLRLTIGSVQQWAFTGSLRRWPDLSEPADIYPPSTIKGIWAGNQLLFIEWPRGGPGHLGGETQCAVIGTKGDPHLVWCDSQQPASATE